MINEKVYTVIVKPYTNSIGSREIRALKTFYNRDEAIKYMREAIDNNASKIENITGKVPLDIMNVDSGIIICDYGYIEYEIVSSSIV